MSASSIDWIFWLYAYLGIGAVTALFFLLLSYKERPSKFVRDMRSALGYGKSLKEYLQDVLVYSIATIVILIGWPGFLIWTVIHKRREMIESQKEDEPQFLCKHQYLIRKVDLIEAENENMVHDPLGLTPKVPFGHLNSAWAKFLVDFGFEDENELWYFEIPKGSKIGTYLSADGPISGYAKVINQKIVGELVIEAD